MVKQPKSRFGNPKTATYLCSHQTYRPWQRNAFIPQDCFTTKFKDLGDIIFKDEYENLIIETILGICSQYQISESVIRSVIQELKSEIHATLDKTWCSFKSLHDGRFELDRICLPCKVLIVKSDIDSINIQLENSVATTLKECSRGYYSVPIDLPYFIINLRQIHNQLRVVNVRMLGQRQRNRNHNFNMLNRLAEQACAKAPACQLLSTDDPPQIK